MSELIPIGVHKKEKNSGGDGGAGLPLKTENFEFTGSKIFTLSEAAVNIVLVSVDNILMNGTAGAPIQYRMNSPTELEILDEMIVGEDTWVSITFNFSGVGGGGGSQNLQQTLNNGRTAEFDGGNTYIDFGNGDENNRTAELTVGDGVNRSTLFLKNEELSFVNVFKNEDNTIYESEVGVTKGLIKLRQQDNIAGKFIEIKVPTSIAEDVTFNFPEKPDGGEFTLVTTLQEAINGTALTQGGNSAFGYLYNSEIDQSVGILMSLSPNNGNAEGAIYLQNFLRGNTNSAYIGAKNGNADIYMENDIGRTTLLFEDPIASETRVLIPAKSLAGDYTLSTATVYGHMPSTPISLLDLNANYPLAQAGDKVHALNIVEGALIYEKTASGWVQYSVTPVAP